MEMGGSLLLVGLHLPAIAQQCSAIYVWLIPQIIYRWWMLTDLYIQTDIKTMFARVITVDHIAYNIYSIQLQ
jgi:hypothetical protein